MAKKKNQVIYLRLLPFWVCSTLGLTISIAGIFALVAGLIPGDFAIGVVGAVVVGGLGGLFCTWVLIFPSRLILKPEHIVLQSFTGRIRGQIPYTNISQVKRFHGGDEEHPTEAVGIDLVKRKAKDTWWPRGLGQTYDVQIYDSWDKPPMVITRLIQAQMDRYYENLGQKKK